MSEQNDLSLDGGHRQLRLQFGSTFARLFKDEDHPRTRHGA
jgi:hypothetical protein